MTPIFGGYPHIWQYRLVHFLGTDWYFLFFILSLVSKLCTSKMEVMNNFEVFLWLKCASYHSTTGCQLDFVKKKKVFLKGSVFKKPGFRDKKVFFCGKWISFQCQKMVFLLHAYLNKNSKNNNITQK